MKTVCQIKTSKLLLVEGEDEKNFFTALLTSMGVMDVQIFSVGGKEQFKNQFPAFVKQAGFSDARIIGFIRDAEENPAKNAFDSICGIIEKTSQKFPVPKNIEEIAANDEYKIGIFIMPDCKSTGMLEDLCIFSVKDSDLFKYADEYVENAEKLYFKENNSNKHFNKPKAQVQTFLAGKVPIKNTLGVAAQGHVWNFENAAFDRIKGFVEELFGVSETKIEN